MAIVTSNGLNDLYKDTVDSSPISNTNRNTYSDSDDVSVGTGVQTDEYDGASDTKFVISPDANENVASVNTPTGPKKSPLSNSGKNKYFNSSVEIDPLDGTTQTSEYSRNDQIHLEGEDHFHDHSELDDIIRNQWNDGTTGTVSNNYSEQFNSKTGKFRPIGRG